MRLDKIKLSVLFLIIALGCTLFGGCAGKKIDEGNPQDLVKDAEEDISDKRYITALDKLKAVKNKFPYSHLATQAKLRIADVYYMEESFAEAAGAYESFRDMHPKHEKADYVIFQIGESYFNQLPGGNDRDLSPAQKAIDAYRELAQLYPKSQDLEKARTHEKESVEILASKEKYIADFYYIRDMYDSAALRYEKIAARFPGSEVEQLAYWRWAQSLIKQDKKDEAKHVFRVYLTRYPQNGEYTQKAGDWLDENGGR